MPGLETGGFQNIRGMPGDFFSRAVHRAGKDGDFHQSDPEAGKRLAILTAPAKNLRLPFNKC
jgi:hypothetical protein